MTSDRKTVGLTPDTAEVVKRLLEKGWFHDGQDVARLAFAISLRDRVPLGVTAGVDTRYAAGNFDPDGDMRALIAALYPDCSTPIRMMEHLVNEGLKTLRARLDEPDLGPDRLLE